MYNEGEMANEATQDQEIKLILSQLDFYKKALNNTYCIYIIDENSWGLGTIILHRFLYSG